MEYAINQLARRLNLYNGSSHHNNQQFIILKRRFRDFKITWYNDRTMNAIRNYAIRLSDPNGVRYMGLSSDTLATEWKIKLWKEQFGLSNPQEGSGRRKYKRRTRKRRRKKSTKRCRRKTKTKRRRKRRR